MVMTGMVTAGMVLCTKEAVDRYDPIFAAGSCDQQTFHPKLWTSRNYGAEVVDLDGFQSFDLYGVMISLCQPKQTQYMM